MFGKCSEGKKEESLCSTLGAARSTGSVARVHGGEEAGGHEERGEELKGGGGERQRNGNSNGLCGFCLVAA